MPRDVNGNYTLAGGNPVISGSLIESSWANSTMDDLSVAMTDSLSRSGNGGMLAPFGFADGSAALPGATFVNEPSMGLFRKNIQEMGISVAATEVGLWTATGLQMTGSISGNPLVLSHAGLPVAQTTPDGMAISGTENSMLSVGTGSTRVTGANDVGGFQLFVNAGGDLNLSHSSAGNPLGFYKAAIAMPRDGGVKLYYNNAVKLETTALGVSFNGSLNGSPLVLSHDGLEVAQTNAQGFDVSSATAGIIRIGDELTDNTADLRLLRSVGGCKMSLGPQGDLRLQVTDPDGSSNGSLALRAEIAGNVNLYNTLNSSTPRLTTTGEGFDVFGAGAIHTVGIGDETKTEQARIRFKNLTHGANINLSTAGELFINMASANGISGGINAIKCIYDAEVVLHYGGINKFQTTIDGAIVAHNNNGATFFDVGTPSINSGAYLRLLRTGFGARQWISGSGNFSIEQINDDGSADEDWIVCNRNDGVRLHFQNVERFRTESTGTLVQGSSSHIGGAVANYMRLLGDSGGASLRRTSTGNLQVRQTTSSGALENTWIDMFRNGSVGIYYNNTKTFSTVATGTRSTGSQSYVTDTGSGSVFFAMHNDNGGLITGIDSGEAGIFAQASGAGVWEKNWLKATRDAGVELFHNGDKKFETTGSGANAYGSNTCYVRANAVGSNEGAFQLISDDIRVNFHMFASGAGAAIRQYSAGNAYEADWINMATNGRLRLYYAGTSKLETTAAGVDVTGSQFNVISTNATVGNRMFGTDGGFLSASTANAFYFAETDNGGNYVTTTIQFYRTGEPQGAAVELRHNNAPKLITTTDGVNITMPTSAAGLSAGDLWNNSGVVNIV